MTFQSESPGIISSLLAHGTFIGTIRVESNRPMQVAVDSTLAFGASTRRYTLREKPNLPASSAETTAVSTTPGNEDEEEEKDPGIHGLLGLPESDTELDVSVDSVCS